jgi:hypothetical protein
MSTTTQKNNCAPSLAQLEKFVKVRNRSGFSSNLQFAFDAEACGFDVKDLGEPVKVGVPGSAAYHWETPHGTLIEVGGEMMLRR